MEVKPANNDNETVTILSIAPELFQVPEGIPENLEFKNSYAAEVIAMRVLEKTSRIYTKDGKFSESMNVLYDDILSLFAKPIWKTKFNKEKKEIEVSCSPRLFPILLQDFVFTDSGLGIEVLEFLVLNSTFSLQCKVKEIDSKTDGGKEIKKENTVFSLSVTLEELRDASMEDEKNFPTYSFDDFEIRCRDYLRLSNEEINVLLKSRIWTKIPSQPIVINGTTLFTIDKSSQIYLSLPENLRNKIKDTGFRIVCSLAKVKEGAILKSV